MRAAVEINGGSVSSVVSRGQFPPYTKQDIVKRSSPSKNQHQQPQGHKLKSIIIDPSRHEVPPRRPGLRVRFADSPHLSPSAMQSSCSTTSSINSSRNTWDRKVLREELHPSSTHRSSNVRTSPTYADIVKRSSPSKNQHQQPQGHKLKSIIIDPSRHEVPPRRPGLRVRFADSPHLSPSAMQSSCSTTSSINSSRNTWDRKVLREELHPSSTHRSSNVRSTTRLSSRIRKITEGRCFICLARGHWAAACEDPITCFRCRRSGHRERDCRQRHQHPRQSVMPRHPPLPERLPREEQSSGHQIDCHTECLHPRSDDSALQHFFTEHANYFQHEIKKMLDAKIQSLCSEFSLLLNAQLQKFQESSKKWMKLAENLVLQSGTMTKELNIASTSDDIRSGKVNQVTIASMQAHDGRLNELHNTPLHLRVARSEATTTTLSKVPKRLGDDHQRPKEIAPSGTTMEVASTSNKSTEVTIQDVEDALLQIENAAAKEPPLSFVSCCSPTHAAGGESNSLQLSSGTANVEPSCPISIQLEEHIAGSPAHTQGLGTVEATTPTLRTVTSPHALMCHQLEDTEVANETSEGTTRLTWRRCRFRQGCVYTRRPRCGSGRPRRGPRGFGAAADAVPHTDIEGQRDTMSPSPEDNGQTAHEVALANFIQSITKPVQQPLLPLQQHGSVKPQREKKRSSKPSRRSARLAAIAWPRGDAQSRARQVLMKRLGITQEEGETREMAFLRCANLIKGPKSDLVLKALVDLSGLDEPPMSVQSMT